jgi:hypothetical protein
MLILTWSVVALLLSINATPLTNCVWFYAFWIIMLNIITPGTYILLPKAVRLYFGIYNIPFNYGLLFTSFVIHSNFIQIERKNKVGDKNWFLIETFR